MPVMSTKELEGLKKLADETPTLDIIKDRWSLIRRKEHKLFRLIEEEKETHCNTQCRWDWGNKSVEIMTYLKDILHLRYETHYLDIDQKISRRILE